MKKQTDKIILGIDPGTSIMGYGLIHVKNGQMDLVTFGVIHLNKLSNHPDKLKRIFTRVDQLILEYHPDEMAIEAPFFGKNVQSMLKLGRAQGVSIAAALHRNIPFEEYTPKKIKQSITGSGNASKEQVAAMLMRMFKVKEVPKHLDATDGLAAAVCHHFQGGVGEHNKSKSGSWKAFLSDNPARLKKK
ncbi:crossover junction endodeoxyribonuclease RuvC [Crocinitomix algicola]|uniref:crossover junction endodeoxyribonuclease RuvC n=1 Tax=Crocinitomix algicola TaxID=1740263 RepID=UPI0021CD7A71|nr:crossover junction endodeoxyribonuclease RuvC [Crocinitomix algicola]